MITESIEPIKHTLAPQGDHNGLKKNDSELTTTLNFISSEIGVLSHCLNEISRVLISMHPLNDVDFKAEYSSDLNHLKRGLETINKALVKQSIDVNAVLNISKEQNQTKSLPNFGLMTLACHEIRNTFNGLFGAMTLLNDQLEAAESLLTKNEDIGYQNYNICPALIIILKKMKYYLATVEACIEQQKEIVEEFLILRGNNKRREFKPKFFNLKDLLETALLMFKSQAEKKDINLQLDYSSEEQWINTDRVYIMQTLVNLLANALKFTLKGEILLKVTSFNQPENKVHWHFSVKDTGIGMTSEEMNKLFHPFCQANNQIAAEYGGSGLGLSICKDFVEKLGGKISVKSQKGLGSKFAFSILCPKAGLKEQQSIESTLNNEQLDSSPKNNSSLRNVQKVLIVDDSKTNQSILSQYLKSMNFEVYIADNGKDAINYCQNIRFSIIFMDIFMPEMCGIQATEKIREIERNTGFHTPIIGLSGSEELENKEKAIDAGMESYLIKPIRKEQIYRVINQYISVGESPKMSKLSNESEELLNRVKSEYDGAFITPAFNNLKSAPMSIETLNQIKLRQGYY